MQNKPTATHKAATHWCRFLPTVVSVSTGGADAFPQTYLVSAMCKGLSRKTLTVAVTVLAVVCGDSSVSVSNGVRHRSGVAMRLTCMQYVMTSHWLRVACVSN